MKEMGFSCTDEEIEFLRRRKERSNNFRLEDFDFSVFDGMNVEQVVKHLDQKFTKDVQDKILEVLGSLDSRFNIQDQIYKVMASLSQELRRTT